MRRTMLAEIATLTAMAWACAPTPRGVLEDAASSLGAADLSAIQYSGSGSSFALGQSPRPGTPWPRFNVLSYERAIDFETRSSRETLVRTQGEDPPHGGGGQPLAGEQRQTMLVSGETAWNMAGENPVPAPAAAVERAIQILHTPHGFVKAALGSQPTLEGNVISFQSTDGHTVRGTLTAENLVEKIVTTISNTVLGDMVVETEFSDYQDFGGVKFPTRIVQQQGGYPTLDIAVSEVAAGVPIDIQVPEAVRQVEAPPITVTSEQIADGVWFLAGGSHHSVLVAFSDHVVVVEAPLGPERSEAVMAEVERLAPEKPIRYLVNTHHHFDHSGGVRSYAANGVTIVTHELNVPFYESLLGGAAFEPVGEHHVLTDGTRTLDIHHVRGNTHNEAMLMAFLPKEKILIEADVFSPRPGPPPSPPNPFSVNLMENITRLKLDVERIAPIHGAVVPLAELKTAIGGGTD